MGKKKKGHEGCIEHYNKRQKILLVGEGDFSFSACLARAFGTAHNMVATCLLSKEELEEMHSTSKEEIAEIEERGGLVLYEVDVRSMDRNPVLREMMFDVIVFNFPHAADVYGFRERDCKVIKKHKKLITAYFDNASEMLKKGGEIHVTHREDYPYNLWEVEELGKDADLELIEKVKFVQDNYPGYHNKRGGINKSNKKFALGHCFTYIFAVD